ncbi:hypothetical protein [Candidiatus Paracoxiella cheracis]|uniref:hypothetical protein n=1 Tax=Candidiatus Paracoxiella cheracis TaxID=3405120 RepID=UPI003BF5E353
MRKTVTSFFGLFVAITSTLIFYNSAVEAPPEEKFNFNLDTNVKAMMLVFAIFIGFNEFFEVIDHMGGHDHNHHNEEESLSNLLVAPTTEEQDSSEIIQQVAGNEGQIRCCTKQFLGKTAKTATTLAVSPLLVAACYSFFTEALSLMQSLRIPPETLTQKLLAIIPTVFMGSRFLVIPVAHTLRNIWGGHEEFTARVTGSNEPVTFLQTHGIRACVFIIFCGTHLTEAFLLSEEIQQDWIKILSIIGLAGSRAIAHLDHVAALPNAYHDWRQRSSCVRCTTGMSGIFSGLAHASSATLSTIYFWKKTNYWGKIAMPLAILVEGATGAVEHQQHGGRHIASAMTRS